MDLFFNWLGEFGRKDKKCKDTEKRTRENEGETREVFD
jgi:hypothetical protein